MLRVDAVSAGYGRMTAVRDVSVEVRAGEILLVIGPNGAGKSTLLGAVSGLVRVQDGCVALDGKDIARWGTERVARAGLRHVLEGHRVFPELTVSENIRLGQVSVPARRRRRAETILAETFDVFPVLGQKRDDRARSLSGGQQQMLALAQAAVSQPRVLMCDEPSLGMARALVPDILAYLRKTADSGVAVVLVEQLVDLPLRWVDQVIVMRQGEVRAQGGPSDFWSGGALAQWAGSEA